MVFLRRNARIDIRPDTLNMDEINEIAKKHKLLVIQDFAHGLLSNYKGKFLGTLGDMGR
jgi:dTDP-4-amino-4,6-dideoxygalactose transaminase